MKDLTISTVFLLKRTELAVRSCAEQVLAKFGLTPTQFLVLMFFKHGNGLSAAQLARNIGVRPQSINDIIGPLERKGLLRRRESKEHRKILETGLSAAGEQLLAKAVPVAAALEQEILEVFTAQELTRFRDGLAKLCSRAEAHESHPTVRRTTALQRSRTLRPGSASVRPAQRRRPAGG